MPKLSATTTASTVPAYADAFQLMIDELLAHPRIDVTHLVRPRVFAKTGKQSFEHWHAATLRQRAIPAPLREVITVLGGFRLRWVLRDAPSTRASTPSASYDAGAPLTDTMGAIAIPDAMTFVSRPHAGITTFDFDTDEQRERVGDADYPRASFRKSIRMFDELSNDYGVSWVAPPGGPKGLALGSDAHASYESRILSVPDYVALLLSTRGAISLRVAHFRSATALQPVPPSLDTIVATLSADAASQGGARGAS